MPRQDGRIEQGQSLKSAISARAWNRAQDAADIVLGQRYGTQADAFTVATLPSVRVRLAERGWFGQVRTPASTYQPTGLMASPSVPVSNSTLSTLSDNEKKLFPRTWFPTAVAGVSQSISLGIKQDVFVCVGNDDNEYTMAGYAITRIRVFNYLHRCARLPQEFPGQTQPQAAAVSGCLDSAFFGPATVVGYFQQNVNGTYAYGHDEEVRLTYPNYEFRWALIKI
jgi:hypothetical protein